MTRYYIETFYTTRALARVDLPDGKTWDDVGAWHIKWDTLYVSFKGDKVNVVELRLDSDSSDGTDWKRPDSVNVFCADEDGDIDYDAAVAEQN